jgi:hypothetical protein
MGHQGHLKLFKKYFTLPRMHVMMMIHVMANNVFLFQHVGSIEQESGSEWCNTTWKTHHTFRDEESDGRRDRETPPDLVATVRSLKEDNERLMRAQDEQAELNAVLLQSLSEIQKHL